MSIDLPGGVEDELRNLAEKQGRDVRALADVAAEEEIASIADFRMEC
jgi:hypothetical protein